jgi:hypothetical protein
MPKPPLFVDFILALWLSLSIREIVLFNRGKRSGLGKRILMTHWQNRCIHPFGYSKDYPENTLARSQHTLRERHLYCKARMDDSGIVCIHQGER